jgi:hypothetical protein
VVTNTGEFDATTVYLFDGQKIVETRDGSGNMVQQFIASLTRRRGQSPPISSRSCRFAAGGVSRTGSTRYIHELIHVRVKDKVDLYVHQGERSEREHAATGKASRDARVRPATCPEGERTMRTTGGANWNVIALTDLGGGTEGRCTWVTDADCSECHLCESAGVSFLGESGCIPCEALGIPCRDGAGNFMLR